MLPKKLQIKGFYSYQEQCTIDFEGLTSTSLFGIFGSVGSGKSAILEAITLALYGETERLNRRDNQYYNMLNLRSDLMKIEFEFEHENNRYLFIVEAKRNSKQFDDVKPKRKAYILNDKDEWEALEHSDASLILNLKYDHFKQIVIIPQGKFNEFVSKSAGDRSKMLKELFPLKKYDLSGNTKKLISEAESNLDIANGRLLELEEYTEEKVNDFEKKLALKAEENKTQEQKHNSLLEEQNKLIAVFEKFEKLSSLSSDLTTLLEREEDIAKLKTTVDKYIRFERLFKQPLAALNQLEIEHKEHTELYTNSKDKLETLESDLRDIQQKKNEIVDRLGDKEIIIKKINDISKLLEIKELSLNLEHKRIKFDENKVLIEQKIEELNKKTAQLEKLRTDLENIQKEKIDLISINAAKIYYNNKHNLQNNIDSLRKQKTTSDNGVEQLKNKKSEIIQLLSNEFTDATDWLNIATNKVIDLCNDKILITENKIQTGQQYEAQIHQKLGLVDYAQHLTTGEPCPLCGSTHHPAPYQDDSVKLKLEAIKNRLQLRNNELNALKQAKFQLEALVQEFERSVDQSKKMDQELIELMQQLHEFENNKPLKYTDLSVDELNELEKNATEQQKEIEEIRTVIDKLQSNKSIEEELTELKQLQHKTESDIEVLQSKINDRNIDIDIEFASLNYADLNDKNEELNQALVFIGEVENKITEHKQELHTTRVLFDSYKKNLEKTETKLDKSTSDFKLLLEKETVFKNDVVATLNQDLDVDEINTKTQAFDYKKNVLKDQIVSLENEIQKSTVKDIDEIAVQKEKLELQLNDSKNFLEVLNKDINILTNQVQTYKEKLQVKIRILKDMDTLNIRLENLKTINKLFVGEGFVKYISTIYLKQLCTLANERFSMLTNHAYALEVDDQYNFIVRDYLHNGQMRLLKTLSGGQTFQAAMCLALALSEQIQVLQGVKQPFFFMDEGFGTLDKESLHLVFDTLKQLRKENRIVGIISHVEELQTEIDHYLHITKDEEKGSLINYSYK